MKPAAWIALLTTLAAFAACTPFDAARDSGDDDANETTTKPTKSKSGSSASNDVPGDATGAVDPSDAVDTSQIDPLITEQMNAGNIPGLAVAVVGDGHMKWAKGYGFANLQAKTPVTRDTLFLLGGTSTAITTAALMQVLEDPKNGITLDSDVSEKLGFTVRHPAYASVPITYRMLLTYTSSLKNVLAPSTPGDSKTPLETFVRDSLRDSASWRSDRPGTDSDYSSISVGLVGLAVEKITGQNLQDYARSRLFQPLAMKESSFFLQPLDPTHVAQPYDGARLTPQGHYGYPDYPSGQLRTSAPQLARFLVMMNNDGVVDGTTLLSSASIEAIVKRQIPSIDDTQGLVFYRDHRGGRDAIGVDGLDKGVRTEMFFDPQVKAGYVLLANSNEASDDFEDAIDGIAQKLMDLAVALP